MGKEPRGTIWPVCSPCGPYMGKMAWFWSTGPNGATAGATGMGFGCLVPRWANWYDLVMRHMTWSRMPGQSGKNHSVKSNNVMITTFIMLKIN
jgi:hypothetical protein